MFVTYFEKGLKEPETVGERSDCVCVCDVLTKEFFFENLTLDHGSLPKGNVSPTWVTSNIKAI